MNWNLCRDFNDDPELNEGARIFRMRSVFFFFFAMDSSNLVSQNFSIDSSLWLVGIFPWTLQHRRSSYPAGCACGSMLKSSFEVRARIFSCFLHELDVDLD